jgi:hypothetical protein
MPVVTSNPEAAELIKLTEQAFETSERKNFERGWDELSTYFLPMQSGIFNNDVGVPGEKKTLTLYDITGTQANHDLASTFHSTVTNPATRWSNIEHEDDELNDDDESRQWLEVARNKMHKAFNQSNFDVEVGSNYKMFCGLGSMSLQHDALPLKKDGRFGGFHFKAFHLAKVAVEENMFGQVDTLYRKFEFTKRQAIQRWGKDTPQIIRESINPDKKFDVYHVIRPRDPDKVGDTDQLILKVDQMPFESIYVVKEGQSIPERGGYMEFPNYFTRFAKMPGEVYGRGPGHLAIPDMRTLNRMVELGLTAIARGIAPPIFSERRNIFSSLNLKPNGLSIVGDVNKIKEFNTGARSDLYQFTKEDYKNSIRQAFFLDKLLLPPREEVGEMTAFEVARRIEQTQRVVGPTFGRLNQDFLQPLVTRSFKMMLRAGAFPDPPQKIKEKGLDIDIKFVNALARSQQIEEVSAINQWTQILAGLAQLEQFDTAATDLLDVDKAGETAARVLGVPEDVITDKGDRDAARDQRTERIQQAEAVENDLKLADAESKRGQ